MSSNRNRHVIAVVGISAGVLSLVVTSVAQWMLQPSGDAATPADVAAQHAIAWTGLGLLAVFGPIVWLAALPAVSRLGGGGLTTRLGCGLTALGLACGVGHLALFFGLYGAVARSGLNVDAVRRLDAASGSEPIGTILLVVFLVGFSLGPIVLTVGLRMAHVVPVWTVVAAVVAAVSGMLGGVPAGIVQMVALLLTWAPIAYALIASSRRAAEATVGAGRA
jgi:hypothetical protein